MINQKIDSTFKTFNPRDYLNEYYSHIGHENSSLLKFFIKAYKRIKINSLLLEFSGGPTIYPLISAAPVVKKVHFADFLDKNIDEVRLWKKQSTKAFDWTSFIRKALEYEKNKKINKEDIEIREKLIRKKLTKFLHCDAFKTSPLGKGYDSMYDAVNVNFVLDSITSSKKVWQQSVVNICRLLKKNGILIMSALKDATYWRAGKGLFPAVTLVKKDITEIFNRLNLKILSFSSVKAEILDEKSKYYEGYKGMMFITAKKT